MWARGMWAFGMWGVFWGAEDVGNPSAGGGDWSAVGRRSRRRRRRTLIEE